MAYIIWGLAIALTLVGGWIDWRSHRLPNWLTVSGLVVGVVANTAMFRRAGLRDALIGAAIPLVILLPVVLLRGLGAGDWKLMGALGAIVGRGEILQVLVVSFLFAGLIALVQMVREKRVKVTLRNMYELVRGFFIFGLKPNPEFSLENAGASTLPFGVAAAAATLLCWGAAVAGM